MAVTCSTHVEKYEMHSELQSENLKAPCGGGGVLWVSGIHIFYSWFSFARKSV